jgi:integrase
MAEGKKESQWERTNVTNLLRNRVSGTYYARVKVNGKQKWRTLETTLFSVAKLRLGDVEKELRAQGLRERGQSRTAGADEMAVGHFIAVFKQRIEHDASIAPATRERRATAIKAVVTTWPDLPTRDIRRVTASDCRIWAANALRTGTGFIAPNVKTKREGMSSSAFNKAVDALRAVFEIARDEGVVFKNAANEIAKAPVKRKRLDLPSPAQFQELLKRIVAAGSKWSQDCADFCAFLAYSGLRRREATAVRWRDVLVEKNQLKVPGTKTESSWRIIPLFPDLERLLRDIQSRRGNEALDAAVIQIGGALGALRSACLALGLKPLTHHDLRHFFATRCIESGVDIPTVSRWLGHSDGGTLAMATYGHLRQEHSLAQAAKVRFR